MMAGGEIIIRWGTEGGVGQLKFRVNEFSWVFQVSFEFLNM